MKATMIYLVDEMRHGGFIRL
ncbi:hypothetical protein PL8927_610038 [Planktothrix serta PCC 8927]|uniref:Uncharacterized protein n=1 Tax=Planktothrix serta PCC 8927 TaxID=671068 RepID=A0A7Z9DYV6_9CYAN|nr:hypothetical protein PL8927_610038 [Planktothrix serta PCC 8927]